VSRYDAPTTLQLRLLDLLKQSKASSYAPMSQAAILGHARHQAAPDEIHDALEGLVDRALIFSMRHTKAGVTQSVYWPTGLKPITPPTQQELTKMAEPIISRLKRLIILHGPVCGAELTRLAEAEGLKIKTKNIPGHLAFPINRGEIVRKLDGDKVNLYMTPAQAECAAIEPTSTETSTPTLEWLSEANLALAKQAKAAASVPLVGRIERYLRQLPPHVAEREAAQLLRAAADEIKRLTGIIYSAADLIDYDIGAGEEARMVREWLTPNAADKGRA
jgi:hypothetical protein